MTTHSVVREKRHVVMILEDGLVVGDLCSTSTMLFEVLPVTSLVATVCRRKQETRWKQMCRRHVLLFASQWAQ